MSTPYLHGILPPVLLPMFPDGTPDPASLERHVTRLLDAGVHGLWVNGSTGEFHALDPGQRAEVVRTVTKAAAGSVPVVAHVGDTSTALVRDHARAAVDAGADRLSVIPPFYADFTQGELCEHYRAIATDVGAPVLAYHLPRLSKVGLTVESIVGLAGEGAICGVKDSGNDMTWFRRLLSGAAEAGVSLPCFTGASAVTDLGLFLGGAGAMPSIANLTPRHLVRMYEAARCGDWPRARRMQDQVMGLVEAMRLPDRLGTWSGPVAASKYVLAALGTIDHACAAQPSATLEEAERRQLGAMAVPLVEQLEHAAR